MRGCTLEQSASHSTVLDEGAWTGSNHQSSNDVASYTVHIKALSSPHSWSALSIYHLVHHCNAAALLTIGSETIEEAHIGRERNHGLPRLKHAGKPFTGAKSRVHESRACRSGCAAMDDSCEGVEIRPQARTPPSQTLTTNTDAQTRNR